jgi:transposase
MLLTFSLFRRRKGHGKADTRRRTVGTHRTVAASPKLRRTRYPGRKPLDNRAVLTGILFVLQTGLRWDLLPREMGCGSGMSCWRRLRDWQAAGVWEQLHEVLLARLRAADQIDWSRVIVDSSSIRAVGSGQKQDRIPQTARDPVQSTISSPKRRESRSR